MVIKCACDLILILNQSFRDGGKTLTGEKIRFVTSVYTRSQVPGKDDKGVEVQKSRRKAVHGALNDLFPLVSALDIDTYKRKSLAKYRQGISDIIAKYRYQDETLGHAEPYSDGTMADNTSMPVDISEGEEEIKQ